MSLNRRDYSDCYQTRPAHPTPEKRYSLGLVETAITLYQPLVFSVPLHP
jgi:hypothetical protein